MSELTDLAWAVGVKTPHEYRGVHVSHAPGSVHGEKTEKGIIEKTNRNVVVNNRLDYRVIDICDFIRTTLVAEEYEHIPQLIDILKREFPDMRGRLVDNFQRGYKGIHLKTAHIDGLCADIHIVTPRWGQLNEIHHAVYEKMRVLPHDSEGRKNLEKIGQHIYDLMWKGKDLSEKDAEISAKVAGYGGYHLKNDLISLPKELVHTLSVPPYSVKDDSIYMNGVLTNQAKVAHDFSVDKQHKLVRICEGLFDKYKESIREI